MRGRIDVTEVFGISGRGTVVVGRVSNASVSVGDAMRLTNPRGATTRVVIRALESGRRNVQTARPGMTVSVLLQGLGVFQVQSGAVLESLVADTPEPDGPEPVDLEQVRLARTDQHAPMLLLPLRIETHFDRDVLRIRAYPDHWHADTFRDSVTPSEADLARRYLDQATGGAQAEAAAFAMLVTNAGPVRAEALRDLARAGPLDMRNMPVSADRPATRLLPTRLIARAILAGGETRAAVGEDIDRGLALGPGAGDRTVITNPDDPLFWLVDYDTAREAGMAIDMPMSASEAEEGIDSLIVFGAFEGDGPEGAAAFTRHLSRLAGSAGLHAEAHGQATKGPQAGRRDLPLPKPVPGQPTPLDRLGRALGLADPLPVRGDPPDHAGLIEAATIIVWEAAIRPTLVHFLQLVDPAVALARDPVLTASRQAIAHKLAPHGPFPPVCVGEVPYGILPVATASIPGTGHLPWLEPLCESIRAGAKPLGSAAERARAEARSPGGFEARIATLLRMPQGQVWRARSGLTISDILTGIAQQVVLSQPGTALRTALRGLQLRIIAARQKRKYFRLNQATRGGRDLLEEALGLPFAQRLCGPLVAKGAENPEADSPVADSDVAALLGRDNYWANLTRRRREPGDEDKPSIFSLLAETALLTTLSEAEAGMQTSDVVTALELLSGEGRASASGLPPRLELAIRAQEREGAPMREIAAGALAGSAFSGRSEDLAATLAAVERLQTAPRGAVHSALAGVIDAFSIRSDVWLMLEAELQIAEARAAQTAEGLQIGAWGYVENLVPLDSRQASWLAAPSQRLALASGLLVRAERGMAEAGLPGVLDADLDSERLREARQLLWLLSGGMPLVDGLSRLIARYLREAGKSDRFAALAGAFPRAEDAPDSDAGQERLGCDAFAALDALAGRRSGDAALLNDLRPELTRAAQALAGLSALTIAEGAAALAEGRVEAAQAALAANAAGNALPANPSMLGPSVPGQSLSFAVAVLGDAETETRQYPDLMSPALGDLVARLTGPLAGRYALTDGDEPNEPEGFSELTRLGLSPLALALNCRPGADPVRRLHKLAAVVEERDVNATRFHLDEAAKATLWAAGRAFRVIAEARPLRPADLGDGEDGITVEHGAADLNADLAAAYTALNSLLDATADALASAGTGSPEQPDPGSSRRRLLTSLIAMDLLGDGDEREAMASASTRIARRLAEADEAADDATALKALLGGLPALVPLRLADLRHWNGGAELQGVEDLPGWLEASAHVRSRLQPLADLLLSAQDMGRAMQWPMPVPPSVASRVDFIGAPLQEDDAYHARAALVVFGARVKSGKSVRGLHLDSWEETVPDRRTTAGLVIEAETPPARAPNTLLLAPAPVGRPWQATDVAAVIDAGMDLARLRTLCLTDLPSPGDPVAGGATTGDVYGDLGQLLPLAGFPHDSLSVLRARCETLLEGDR